MLSNIVLKLSSNASSKRLSVDHRLILRNSRPFLSKENKPFNDLSRTYRGFCSSQQSKSENNDNQFLSSLFQQIPGIRIRRSLLFVPGNDAKKMQKIAKMEKRPDIICFDLEDSVSASNKVRARSIVVDALTYLDFGDSELFIRINKIGSGLERDDLKAVLAKNPTGIYIPKVENALQVSSLSQMLGDYENRSHVSESMRGGNEGDNVTSIERFSLFCGIETATGVLNLQSIATADDRIEALLFGAEDYASNIGAKRSKGNREVDYARSSVINCAAANHIDSFDMVHTNYRDQVSLHNEAKAGFDMGFTGKQAIHPDQIPTIHKAFAPTADEIVDSFSILKLYVQNQRQGSGVFGYQGRMVDFSVAMSAAKILHRANILKTMPQ